MEIFKLQIHKKGDLKSFYEEVDYVLNKYSVIKNGTSKNLVKQSIAHALQKMMKYEDWFNICTIDKAAKVCNKLISRERKNIYNLAHCINWADMTKEYRECLIAMVMDDFREILTYEESTNKELKEVAND